MNRFCAAAALALCLGATGAFAADAPIVIDEQAIEMATKWSGFYAGVGVTGAYNVNLSETFGFGDLILGGNVQNGSFVFGAEAFLSGWISNLAGPGTSLGGEVRGGYLVSPNALLYLSGGVTHFVTGGATYGQLGAGIEFGLGENTTIDVEYKYWQELSGAGIYRTHSLSTSLLWHF